MYWHLLRTIVLIADVSLLQNFLPKLKQHLLSRILSPINSKDQGSPCPSDVAHPDDCDPNVVLFQGDRIYSHRVLRINYTTYDVRRSQDVVNPYTSHCNIMVLNHDADSALHHWFRYARVLGIYHANVVYMGHGVLNYQPRRMEFLWVRWYQIVDPRATGWHTFKLDRVKFFRVTDDDAFGFIDLSDVLRGSYIVPAFARGRPCMIRGDVSLCARNPSDYIQYYVNR